MNTKDQLKVDYLTAKQLKLNTLVMCPTCKGTFKKKRKAHVFCTNRRDGPGNCADAYWNIVDPKRGDRR